MGPGRSPKVLAATRKRRSKEDEMGLTLTPSEKGFFDRVKAALGARENWLEFLKILDLYSAEVLTRAEMISLAQDVLNQCAGGAAAGKLLLDELKSLVANKGITDATPQDIWASMPIAEVDFSQCARCTPSSRHLPAGYPRAACSERSRLEASVLNDHWVSVPTDYDDFHFKLQRKSQYELTLYECEDERHEAGFRLIAPIGVRARDAV
jgi:paired amphipathic helix protein Sin3a